MCFEEKNSLKEIKAREENVTKINRRERNLATYAIVNPRDF